MLACSHQTVSSQAVKRGDALTSRTLFTQQKLNGNRVVQLSKQVWLANSENLGLFTFNDSQEISAQHVGNYESLDARRRSQNEWIVSSIEKEQGRFELFSLNTQTQKLQPITTIRLPETVINNQCLYQDPHTGALQVFLLTAEHQVAQYLINLQKPDNLRLIRQFPSPPGTETCRVDDAGGYLYLVEEMLGVWQYPVDPEAELSRTAVAMSQPFGKIDGEIKDLQTLDDGSLLIVLPETSSVQHYKQPIGSGEMVEYFIPESTIESVFAFKQQDNWQLSLYDDAHGRYLQSTLVLAVSERIEKTQKIATLTADMQTEPVARFADAADDPEIWWNAESPENSLVLATDKTYGLKAYDLSGKEVADIATGRINNIDILRQLTWQGKRWDFAAASNRSDNSIALYSIDQKGNIQELPGLPTSLPDVYGLCTYKSPLNGAAYVFINDESGAFQQYQLNLSGEKISAQLVREFAVESQPEGCVVDLRTQTLYLGEENKAIWTINAEPHGNQLNLFYAIDNKTLFADVEGLSIYHAQTAGKADYLVASSQGNNSYLVFDLSNGQLATRFKVVADAELGIDGSSETDGLAVISESLGDAYPNGALVVQDGRNVMPVQPQNFKLIDWRKIQALIDGQ